MPQIGQLLRIQGWHGFQQDILHPADHLLAEHRVLCCQDLQHPDWFYWFFWREFVVGFDGSHPLPTVPVEVLIGEAIEIGEIGQHHNNLAHLDPAARQVNIVEQECPKLSTVDPQTVAYPGQFQNDRNIELMTHCDELGNQQGCDLLFGCVVAEDPVLVRPGWF